ncbi:MAG: N-acetylneuraminate synthase [Candidatus Riflebacteria bacterium]|nr:N-acetylneuraminate synthase [Candidatus Riflebacteria bacterium]
MKNNRNVYIIAEAGVNHNGSVSRAVKMVKVAATYGADAIKFQTFKADRIVTRSAPKADYQINAVGNTESQFEMIKNLELSLHDHLEIKAACDSIGIEFLSTPFDVESVDLLVNIVGVSRLKIPSGEITNPMLLLKAARTGKPLIISTGMSTLGEIEDALGVVAFGLCKFDLPHSEKNFRKAFFSKEGQEALKEKVSLLHCTTEYPAAFQDTNLFAMDTIRSAFNLPTGLSDHTSGTAVPIAAVARGAEIIEKHFTLDKSLPGPDHKASLEPDELRQMVLSIKSVEKALGNSSKMPVEAELKNLAIARKSLVALTSIKEGTAFTPENLGVKRPGTGISPMKYWEYLGKKARRDYSEDELIENT